MRNQLLGIITGILGVFVSGCISDSEAVPADEFQAISYTVESNGTQTDIQNQRNEVINNSDQLSNLLSTVPTTTGEVPNPDFSTDMLVSIFTGFGPCTNLEISSVKESVDTVLVNLVRVNTVFPGLCDPSPIGFITKHYVFISVARTYKPFSFKYEIRDDY